MSNESLLGAIFTVLLLDSSFVVYSNRCDVHCEREASIDRAEDAERRWDEAGSPAAPTAPVIFCRSWYSADNHDRTRWL